MSTFRHVDFEMPTVLLHRLEFGLESYHLKVIVQESTHQFLVHRKSRK